MVFARGLSLAGAAAALLAMHHTDNPRFIQQPWRDHEPMAWRGRKKHNPNAAKQAAAKRARKITRRNAP